MKLGLYILAQAVEDVLAAGVAPTGITDLFVLSLLGAGVLTILRKKRK